MKKSVMLFLVLLVLGSASMISGLAMDAPIPRFADARVLGMGNVQGPVSKGVSALFANPAGIARKNEIIPLRVSLGGYINVTPEVLNELGSVFGISNGYVPYEDPKNEYEEGYNDGFLEGRGGFGSLNMSSLDFGQLIDYGDLANGIGVHSSGVYGLSLAGFGFSRYYSADLYFEQHMPSEPIMLNYFSESSVNLGASYGFDFNVGTMYVGIGWKYSVLIISNYNTGLFDTSDLQSRKLDPAEIPAYVATDALLRVGAIFETGPFLLSLHVNNISIERSSINRISLEYALGAPARYFGLDEDTSFEFSKLYFPDGGGGGVLDANDPMNFLKIPLSVTAGFGIELELGNILGVTAAASYDKVFYREDKNKENDTLWKNLHIGTEVDLFDSFKVRGGINQGYFTGGVGVSVLRIFNVKLDINATYYAREFGSFAGHRQSESLLLEIGLRI